MKYKVILLLIIQLFVINILSAQSLSESLGGTKTNFRIYSGPTELITSEQIIILRAEKNTFSDLYAGWGYGYRSFHLEFISNKNIVEMQSDVKSERYKMKLTLYDADNKLLTTITLPSYYLNEYSNSSSEDALFIYSLDLIDIPVVILDNTKKIDIVKFAK